MKYAVLRTGGKQYRVSEGDVFEVDKLSQEKDKKIVFEDVLLSVLDNSVDLGKPNISGTRIEATILENIKGEKIRVSKFKAKSRYRRTNGFRPQYSRIRIDKISQTSKSRIKASGKK